MLVNDGIKEGLLQERALGRKEGALALLERQLTRHFGPLPKTIQRKLAKADLPQLEAWSDLLAEAESLQQVFK
jgi:predicted secreted protein